MQVLSTFLPLRYDLASFGNSWAQRQIFNITMIEAAVRAQQVPLALALVAELKVSVTVTHLKTRILPTPPPLPPSSPLPLASSPTGPEAQE